MEKGSGGMKTKLITAIMITLFLAGMVAIVIPVKADSGRFAGMTYEYRVATPDEVAALPHIIDATGKDIAILVEGSGLTIEGLIIHDAEQFGIAVDAQSDVKVTGCEIYNIGYHSSDGSFDPNGCQYGNAIYFYGSSGEISYNTVGNYQKGGIIANLPSPDGEPVNILYNTVRGLGPVTFIAQNGIQMGWGAKGTIRGNTVSGNYYISYEVPGEGKAIGQQAWVSCGILLYLVEPGENGVKPSQNKIQDNQVPIYVYPVH